MSSALESAESGLAHLHHAIVSCAKCPRLVAHREAVAREKRPMYNDWEYWGRPVPGFGDPNARLLLLGLAPAAHGANRTGRMFTGDRSGDWVYGTLHKFGFAESPHSQSRDDGQILKDVYITAAVRCAPPGNKPFPEERNNCLPFLVRELELLKKVQVVLVFGKFAFDVYLGVCSARGAALPSPRPKFGHAAVYRLAGGITLAASYHPSQHNTLTGRLTREMFEGVFDMAKQLLA